MEEHEKVALRQLRLYLLEEIETSWIADELYSYGVLSSEQLLYFKRSQFPVQRASDLLLFLPDHCSLKTLLDALDNAGQRHVSDQIRVKTEENVNIPLDVFHSKPHYGESFKRYSKIDDIMTMWR